MDIVPFLSAPAISIGSALFLYYKVSRKAYHELEKAYGEKIESLSKPEREKLLIQEIVNANRGSRRLQPSFIDFRFGGYKLFAKKYGINLGELLKPDILLCKIKEYGVHIPELTELNFI